VAAAAALLPDVRPGLANRLLDGLQAGRRHPERFGKGELEGIVAPETAAHAAGVAAMLPMITLGIPGSPTAGVMLGGLHHLGPAARADAVVDNLDFVWGLIASMYTGNVIGVLVVLTMVPLFAAILRIPFVILTPPDRRCVRDRRLRRAQQHDRHLVHADLRRRGLRVQEARLPPGAPGAGARPGDLSENALRQSLIMSQGSLAIFFVRPIAAVITAVAILFFVLPVITPWWRRARGRATMPPTADPGEPAGPRES
jgi:TctA family transporter